MHIIEIVRIGELLCHMHTVMHLPMLFLNTIRHVCRSTAYAIFVDF